MRQRDCRYGDVRTEASRHDRREQAANAKADNGTRCPCDKRYECDKANEPQRHTPRNSLCLANVTPINRTRRGPRSASSADRPPRASCLMRWLEKLDWIAVRIEDLDLPACRSGFHGVPKRRSGLAQRFDDRGQIAHSKNDAVGAAGTLPLAVRQDPRSRRSIVGLLFPMSRSRLERGSV